MIIVADSGSTKADWIFADGKGFEGNARTKGVNPFLHSASQITQMIQDGFGTTVPVEKIDRVHYYGAGCSDHKRCTIMEAGLQRVFPNARIYVEHDLLAAARATCLNEAGIACILGTGSNSCLYDGQQIQDNIPSLGYLIGDEGSGGHIGKSLLRAFYYREMPASLATFFEQEIASDKTKVFDQMYGPSPNVYLASLAEFLGKYLDDPFAKTLAFSCFSMFIDKHVSKYEGYKTLPIHFVGSIAYHFKPIIVQVLRSYELNLGTIIHKPIQSLLSFHLTYQPN